MRDVFAVLHVYGEGRSMRTLGSVPLLIGGLLEGGGFVETSCLMWCGFESG